MNKRHGCSHCKKTLAFIRIKMVISVVQSIDFFPLSKVKKLIVRVVFAPSRDFLVLKRSFKACPESGRDRLMDG